MSKVDEAISLLKALGLPRAQQNERSALTLLAILDLKEGMSWSQSKKRAIRIHDILVYMQRHYGKEYAENTRETIRRQTIHQFEQAGIMVRNPDDPSRPTNSPKTVYAVTDDALETIREFQSSSWRSAVQRFVKKKGRLIEKYEKRREEHLIPVDLPDGTLIGLSPGRHNELQAKIIKDFRATFCPSAKVVYVGDSARKLLYLNEELSESIGIPITRHGKLPDVVLYDPHEDLLYLIEAVTAHGPLSPKRQIELEEILRSCRSKRVYISAFPDFHEFKRHINDIAWETEVWIEESRDHLVHFNGPKFLSVHTGED